MKLFDFFKKSDKRTAKRKTGDIGEDLAVEYLKKNRYVICERNWRFGKNEIDIIAKKNTCLIFVEVKTTSSDRAEDFRLPMEAVTREKQRNVIEAARVYLGRVHSYNDKVHNELFGGNPKNDVVGTRFDVIEVYLNRDKPEINHIENAFYVEKGNKRKWKT